MAYAFIKKSIIFLSMTPLLHAHAVSLQSIQEKCQKNSAKSCYELGILQDQKENSKQASVHYRHACGLGYGLGCYKLAELYLIGSGVKQNDEMFVKFMKKSCALGYQKSCSFTAKAAPAINPIPKPPSTVVTAHTSRTAAAAHSNKDLISIKKKGIGRLGISVKRISKPKRILRISASMLNQFSQATGWLSFSFPQVGTSILLASQNRGFDKIRTYPSGANIYHQKKHHAVQSDYLLIEGEAKQWGHGKEKGASIDVRVPDTLKTLIVYVRATLKHGNTLRSLPRKGSIGQQGFHNYALRIPVGPTKEETKGQIITLTPTAGTRKQPLQTAPPLDRKEKLLLLDQLFTLSYFHRDRKAFEKQLKETLFGDAKYLSTIKSYQCKPVVDSQDHMCLLKLAGQAKSNNRLVQWEFHAAFTATKTTTSLKISEMRALDLLE